MVPQTKVSRQWTLASVALADAWTDFILSRQAKNATPATIAFYRHTARVFLDWCEQQGITSPDMLSGRYVRAYLAELVSRGKKDTTLNAHARAIRTLFIFWHEEGYLPSPIKFDMPKLTKKKLPVLTAEQLQQVINACENPRDKALVLFLADSGLRRAEICNLNWDDVNLESGLVRVVQGKGQKDRSSVIGAVTRRALLKYRRTLEDVSDKSPMFQSRTQGRLTGSGVLIIFRRLRKKTNIQGLSPHALRRTFAILSLRAGMSPLHLQNLGGWTDLTMVDHYSQMVDDDLLAEHKAHSPVDSLRGS